jgi:hypothetical protein
VGYRNEQQLNINMCGCNKKHLKNMEQMYGKNIRLKVISKLLSARIDFYEDWLECQCWTKWHIIGLKEKLGTEKKVLHWCGHVQWVLYEGLPKVMMLCICLNKSTYEYVQRKSWHKGVKVAVSNIKPAGGQWMNRNAAPAHLMTMTLYKTGHRL